MTTPATDTEWFTVTQVAAMFQLTAQTVRDWIANGELEAKKLDGRQWRISRAAINKYVEAH